VTVLHQYKGVDVRQSKEAAAPVKRSASAAAVLPTDENAVAVLPMENFSAEPGHDYLADGMTEILIADLTKAGGLHVISRTSSMHFKGHTQTLRAIAEELGVKWIIEGSIVKAGERVRITAQLIDAATDQHRWAESYERPVADLLAIQAEVASAIASAVTAALPGSARSGQTATATPGVLVRPVRPL
jgi:TolB-like protein